MNQVYITGAASYLPNDPVCNDAMEDILGQVGDQPSIHREKILKRNGIEQRYYARKDGLQTHLNEELAANAIKNLLNQRKISWKKLRCLPRALPLQMSYYQGSAQCSTVNLGDIR